MKNEKMKLLKLEFKKLFEKLEKIIKSTNREKSMEDVIDVVQLSYFVYHRINDDIKIVNKL